MDRHSEQYLQCLELFDHRRYTECFQLCLRTMTDPNLSLYLQTTTLILKIKTILVISAAEPEADADGAWWKAEVSVSKPTGTNLGDTSSSLFRPD